MGIVVRYCIRLFLELAGIVLFAWFFIPALMTANFHIGAVTGMILSLLLILYGFLGAFVDQLIREAWHYPAGKIVLCILGAICAAILGLAIACMISMGTAERKATKPDSTVVVLGCRVYRSGPSRMLVSRLNAALEYLEENPDSVCIVCGGQGSNEPCTESSAMRTYLESKGIDPSRIYEDATSMDTLENLTNARRIISENALSPQTAISTNDYHMYRALKYAGEAGLEDPGAISATTLWWMFPSVYIREMYGILEMWFLK